MSFPGRLAFSLLYALLFFSMYGPLFSLLYGPFLYLCGPLFSLLYGALSSPLYGPLSSLLFGPLFSCCWLLIPSGGLSEGSALKVSPPLLALTVALSLMLALIASHFLGDGNASNFLCHLHWNQSFILLHLNGKLFLFFFLLPYLE